MTNRPGSSRLLLDFLHADSLGRFLLAFVKPRQANWKHRQVRTLRPFEDWSVHDKLSIRPRANWLSGVTVAKKDVTANRKGARGWGVREEENHFIPSAPACVCVCVCVCEIYIYIYLMFIKDIYIYIYIYIYITFEVLCWSCKVQCAHFCQWNTAP